MAPTVSSTTIHILTRMKKFSFQSREALPPSVLSTACREFLGQKEEASSKREEPLERRLSSETPGRRSALCEPDPPSKLSSLPGTPFVIFA